MFEGKNTIILCDDDMKKAVEYYLNSKVFKEDITVTSIDPKLSPITNYEIHFEESPE